MSNIQPYQPKNVPALVQVVNKPKIKDYPPEVIDEVVEKLINGILLSLNVQRKNDDKTVNYLLVGQMIKTHYSKYSVEEIMTAFDLAIIGDIKVKVYRMLDKMILANVMQAYEVYKREELHEYKQELKLLAQKAEYEKKFNKELTFEDFYPVLVKAKRYYNENQLICVGCNYLYRVLKDLKLMDLSETSKKRIMAFVVGDFNEHNKKQKSFRIVDRKYKSVKDKHGKFTSEFKVACENVALGEWLENWDEKK